MPSRIFLCLNECFERREAGITVLNSGKGKLQALVYDTVPPATAVTAWLPHRFPKRESYSLVLR